MDRISYISYVLYQSHNENLKKWALELLNGTITLREVKVKSQVAEAEIQRAELLYKNGKLDYQNVFRFVAEYMELAS
ncbi:MULTISPECIES: hypothetical protein [Bacillaceae]|uniref:Uncharacterized protein n=2 Tax=Bacillaceae TaxID=186817 RepID=A0A090ISU1_9BACI|nr:MULTISPECIES: hypothetical protein [Bacillaceae]MCB5936163.1 hypothetical protein [Bacillus sp. DFI.2.34]KIO63383.1 hypothetical protein B4166_0209 [Caldibacillus thermoamylovorans]KIO69485.1 hypothetical protein B4065_1418 [Caldibacillus thermoamylovorans]KIO72918.1 hypothetical protein B4167_2561 [Caldibacillus thermoamylovorans]MBU5341049.1 hypothetical protein [Caldifermentibacillus hisashii]